MKLFYSFIKELNLASKSYYFYLELVMALIILAVLLFVVPENFSDKQEEFISLEVPEEVENYFINEIEESDIDNKSEIKEFELDDKTIKADYYETEEKEIYVFNDRDTMFKMTKGEIPSVGAHITWDEDNEEFNYEYVLQGYESDRLKNLYLIIHNEDVDKVTTAVDSQRIESLKDEYEPLSDRQMALPSLLTFNGSLMGLFIIAAYIFLDKKEGIIKAYAITASKVWVYLMSKVGVLIITTIISSLIIIVPIMKTQPNYLTILLLLITSAFFASSLGLLLASFYKNINQAFGAIYFIIILMLLPNIAYFIPSWEPAWIKVIPSYPLIYGFKESIIVNGDINYTLMASAGFLIVGIILFGFANFRYKRTLSV
jgi:hypothetical protein